MDVMIHEDFQWVGFLGFLGFSFLLLDGMRDWVFFFLLKVGIEICPKAI